MMMESVVSVMMVSVMMVKSSEFVMISMMESVVSVMMTESMVSVDEMMSSFQL